MKLYYIVNARIPTENAHGIQVMKMCEAFAREGMEVTLVVPKRRNTIKSNPFVYYDVEQNFTIKYIPTIDLFGTHIPFAFSIGTLAFALSVRFFLKRKKENAILYTRGESPLLFTICLPERFKLFWETHIKPNKMHLYQNILLRSKGVIVVTKYYQNELIEKYNIPSEKILNAADGVDLDMFDVNISKEEARARLSLSPSKRILVSTSSPVEWKGVPILESIVKHLPNEFETVFVGIEKEINDTSQVSYVGKRPYKEIPLWLKAADILLLPGDPTSSTSVYYTSPLKLFEYMASKRPIIAFDIPSFRDVLNERNAFFIDPLDTENAVKEIMGYFSDDKRMEEKAKNAFRDVVQYTWSRRAENILSFIDKQK